ncbi:hypothetical protein [Moorena producens]|uniref:hypothetical protein n=1 Tax=Moorena producens TaxID=1155739 RepID=UPI003C77BC8D
MLIGHFWKGNREQGTGNSVESVGSVGRGRGECGAGARGDGGVTQPTLLLLPIAYCLLPIAYSLLPTPYSLLPKMRSLKY